MNAAFEHGKNVEEDILTSDIFGLLKYLPPNLVLWPFLQKAESFDRPTRYRIADRIGRRAPASADFFFWPRTSAGREPDLVLILRDESGDASAIVVEVKFHSGKHDLDRTDEPRAEGAGKQEPAELSKSDSDTGCDGDQLGNYFRALLKNEIFLRAGHAASGSLGTKIHKKMQDGEGILRSGTTKKFLIYLTADASPPEDDINKTLESVAKSVPADGWRGRMYWLGWRSLYEVVDAALNDSGANLASLQREILSDILRLLDLRNLRPFEGYKELNLDVSVGNAKDVFFWRRRWFKDISLPEMKISPGFYFWRETLTR